MASRFLLAWVLCVAALPARAELEVFEGFMDEEVKFVLERLVRENPGRQVIVLERSRATEDMLFELPVAVYGQKPVRRIVADDAVGDSFEARWSRTLAKELKTAEPALKASVVGGQAKPKTNVGSEKFELLTFNGKAPVSAKNPPIVLVRSPEMGLQPALVPVYQKAIVQSLQKLDEGKPANGGVNFSFFGTSGAVASHEQPGDLNRVTGSLYVGVDLVPGEEGRPPRYRGVIKLIEASGNPPKTFFSSETFDDRGKAEEAAKKAFNRPGASDLKNTDRSARSDETLGSAVRDVMQTHGGSVSLTVSFFGGDAEKATGRSLGLTNVNMEDYHVLASMPDILSSPGKGSVGVTRYNCDPPDIPPLVVSAMETWGEETKYTPDAYVDAILWGLKGSIAEQAPKSGKWTALDVLEEGMRGRFAYQLPNDGGILDPFYAEIASDFLSSILKGKAFGLEIFSLKAVEQLTKGQKEDLQKVLDAHSKVLAAEAAEVYKEFAKEFGEGKLSGEAELRLRKMLGDLVAKTQFVEIPEGPLRDAIARGMGDRARADMLKNGRLRMLAAPEEGKMEVWVRSGKWKQNVSMTLEHLLREIDVQKLRKAGSPEERARLFRELVFGSPVSSLDGANADRALYKTGLVGGLPRASREHVLREKYRESLRDEKTFERELETLRPKLKQVREALRC